MSIVARLGFAVMKWNARHGLRSDDSTLFDEKKIEALGIGARGEQFAYWYLRRLGYIFIARNYTPVRSKGEIDLVGYVCGTLAFVEVAPARRSKASLLCRS